MRNFKKIVFCVLAIFSFINFTSCNDNDENQDLIEVIGEWELYRDENLESVIDQWTGTAWTFKDEWYANIREDSEIILVFIEDGTFEDRYANVKVANGNWVKIEEGRYYFDYVNEDANEDLRQRRYLNILCDNTFSIKYEDDDRNINYYRKIGTTECFNLITYNVTE